MGWLNVFPFGRHTRTKVAQFSCLGATFGAFGAHCVTTTTTELVFAPDRQCSTTRGSKTEGASLLLGLARLYPMLSSWFKLELVARRGLPPWATRMAALSRPGQVAVSSLIEFVLVALVRCYFGRPSAAAKRASELACWLARRLGREEIWPLELALLGGHLLGWR